MRSRTTHVVWEDAKNHHVVEGVHQVKTHTHTHFVLSLHMGPDWRQKLASWIALMFETVTDRLQFMRLSIWSAQSGANALRIGSTNGKIEA